MSAWSELLERWRGIDPDLGLRPPYPPLALELDGEQAVLVRLKRRRRGLPLLEAHGQRRMPVDAVPASIFQPVTGTVEELAQSLRALFEASGTKPGRVAIVLPDNLAKVSLLQLPERPASHRQLEELVRSKMRRAVPFRLDEAALSFQLLPGEGREVAVLVVLVRRALIDRLEQALEAIGARPGLIDICTPNLLNLARGAISRAAQPHADVALLNSARNYFSLAIVRRERLIFFRCKTLLDDTAEAASSDALLREVTSSFSYYREKLQGEGVGTLLVRSAATPVAEVVASLGELGLPQVEAFDTLGGLRLGSGVQLDPQAAQRIAPAMGAACGRGR